MVLGHAGAVDRGVERGVGQGVHCRNERMRLGCPAESLSRGSEDMRHFGGRKGMWVREPQLWIRVSPRGELSTGEFAPTAIGRGVACAPPKDPGRPGYAGASDDGRRAPFRSQRWRSSSACSSPSSLASCSRSHSSRSSGFY